MLPDTFLQFLTYDHASGRFRNLFEINPAGGKNCSDALRERKNGQSFMSGKKQNLRITVLSVFVFAVLNLCLDLCYFQDYRDKTGIVAQMLQADSNNQMDTAAGILKYGPGDARKGKELLEQYGYGKNTGNSFYTRFIRMCIMTGIVSGGLLLLIQAVCMLDRKKERAGQDAWLWQLGQFLSKLREESGDVRMEPPQADDAQGPAYLVNEQLELLVEYLEMTRESSFREKESVKRLVTDISHQLKTPVAALDTCFCVLEDSSLSRTEREEFYRRCKNQLEALKSLLDSLIRVSGLEAGMIQLEFHKAPVLDTLIAAVNRVYPKASAKQLEFVFDYDSTLEKVAVKQDERWLCEAFINVLDNGIKYSPADGEIHLTLLRFYGFVRIEIEDTGIGIPGKEYHKIFQRFYRVSDRRVRQESGSGVGLYLAREIIEQHHGTISVRLGRGKEPDRPGSIFIIQLPWCRDI